MKRLGVTIGAIAALQLSACARMDGPAPDAAGAPSQLQMVVSDLRDASGAIRARATAEQVGDSIRVRVESIRMTHGAYGAHVHTTGRCEAPGFTTAGPHWNPTAQQHGKDNPQGMHKGDLPNLLVGTDGRGSFEYTIPNAAIAGSGPNVLLDQDGAAVVVHQSSDDFRTDPSGNSGNRIACGVLG